MKRKKRLLACMASAVLWTSILFSGVQAETADLSRRDGVIDITPRVDGIQGQVVHGTAFTLHQVAEAVSREGVLGYELTEAFSASGADLGDLNRAELSDTLAQYASQHSLSGRTAQADANGLVRFTDLSTGLYLLAQTNQVEGYEKVSPFLVSLPMTSADGTQWLYQVDASPKAAASPLTPTPAITALPTPPGSVPPKLPQTGQLNWPIPILAGAGMVLFMAGWSLRRR